MVSMCRMSMSNDPKKRESKGVRNSAMKTKRCSQASKTYRTEYKNMTTLLEHKSSTAMRNCNPKKNEEFISPECYAIWTDIEEILVVIETIKKLDELQALDFDI